MCAANMSLLRSSQGVRYHRRPRLSNLSACGHAQADAPMNLVGEADCPGEDAWGTLEQLKFDEYDLYQLLARLIISGQKDNLVLFAPKKSGEREEVAEDMLCVYN